MAKNKNLPIWLDSSLRKAWLEQLTREYENICYWYGVKLQKPAFELNESHSCFGSWNSKHRIITISSRLLYTYPWTTTIAVLKHEMAHQICGEQFCRPDESHGELFKKACGLIGLFGDMSRNTADLSGSFADICDQPGEITDRGRRVLEKVEKLLALSGSDNEHEASLAMQRAGDLLEKHNLSMDAVMAAKNNFIRLIISTGKQRMATHLRYIVSLLQKYFFVDIVLSSTYDPVENRKLRTIELFGKPENVAVGEYCYRFLVNTLDSLWQANRGKFKGGGLRARNSYFIGVVAGFSEKMAGKDAINYPSGKGERGLTLSSIVVQRDVALRAFISAHYPKLRKANGGRVQLHGDAYREAVETGRKLTFKRAVNDSSSGFGILIEEETGKRAGG